MRLDLKNPTPSKPSVAKSLKPSPRRRRRSREFLTFLVFVLLSATFWFVQSLQRRFTYTLRIPVTYDSIPPEVGLQSKLPEFVEVSLEDEGGRLLEYSMRGVAPIRLHPQRDHQLIAGFSISATTLSAEVRSRLSSSARIISVSPSVINASAYRRQRKVLPITLGSLPQIATGYAVGEIEFTPAEVTVFASGRTLDTLTSLRTEPFAEETLTTTTTTKVRIHLPEGVYASTTMVQVHIPVEQLTEQTFTLPVEVTGLPEGFILQPLPSSATIQLTLPRSRYKEIQPEDLTLAVAYPTLVSSGEAKPDAPRQLPIQLIKKPDWLKNYRITPDHVQYVIEERK